jgi:hypothetical protein
LLTIMKGTIASWRLIPPCPTTTSPLLLKALSELASKGYVLLAAPSQDRAILSQNLDSLQQSCLAN